MLELQIIAHFEKLTMMKLEIRNFLHKIRCFWIQSDYEQFLKVAQNKGGILKFIFIALSYVIIFNSAFC